MEKNNEYKEIHNVHKFYQKGNDIPDSFSEKLRRFVKKVKIIPKNEKINFLNAVLGISSGLNSIQEKKIKKELIRLQDIYKSFSPANEKIDDINKIFEEKFKKCEKHQKIKYFFCEKHRAASLLCNECCEEHIKGSKEQITQSDIDSHELYYFPSYLLIKIEERLVDLNKLLENKDIIEAICDSVINKKKYIDYNYYYLSKIIDDKFTELSEFLKEQKSLMKSKLKENVKKMKNKEYFNDDFWFKTKETINDEFYSYYNTVISKLSNFKLQYDDLILNNEENIKRDNIENELNINEFTQSVSEKSEFQPLFSCAYIDLDKIKQTIKENVYLFEERLKKEEIINLKQLIINDELFKEKQRKVHFFLDKKYSIRLSDIYKKKKKKEITTVNIETKNNELIDDLDLSMLFPINSAKLYLNGRDLIKECDPKIILIGGFYQSKANSVYNNYFSIFDNDSNTLHLNYYVLNYFENNKLKKYSRIGVKVLLITRDEIKKAQLIDYYSLLLFGGDTLEGNSTNDVFLLKGINHILSGKVVKDNKYDTILEHIPQIKHERSYSEILKFNSFLYFFGGVNAENGEINDNVLCMNLLDFNFRKEFKLPRKLFAFTFSYSPSRGNYLLIGGMSSENDCLVKNDLIYELSIKDDQSIYYQEIGKLNRKRIKPTIAIDGENILIIGGERNWLMEVFNINEYRITNEVNSTEIFEETNIKNSQIGCFLVN